MYFKVASIVAVSLFFTGCSLFSSPKPPKKPEVKVVEEINATVEDSNITEVPEDRSSLEAKYNLKPEPFSLASNEDDPELLGPQTTIDRGLLKKEETSSDKTSKPKEKKEESKKDSFEKAVKKDEPKKDSKKETL